MPENIHKGIKKALKLTSLEDMMGLWFFLTVVVAGNMLLKAYKWRSLAETHKAADHRVAALESELKIMREKIRALDDAVFLGDFELKQKFKDLEKELAHKH